MRSTSGSRVFKVHRREPELIAPAKPTPHEFKPLSDIDDQECLRFQIPIMQIYRQNPSMKDKDPVKVIREALGRALVFYYPFAGRLREWPNRKLVVECTGEGVMFIEADADVELENTGNLLKPPFPLLNELLFDVPGSNGVVNCPLLLIQVTRFKCGGFVFGIRLNHTMSDGFGFVQFMLAIGEMARGQHSPTVLPVWERQVLSARNPPITTCVHREYDDDVGASNPFPLDDLVDKAFLFGPTQISNLRKLVPPHLPRSSTFEILAACLWKCRTFALQPDPTLEMRMMSLNNARNKLSPDLIPNGYYGNAFVLSTPVATARELFENPISHALELIQKSKAEMSKEYIQSVADTIVINNRRGFPVEGTYLISDLRYVRFREVDFGWGKAVYGGPAKAVPIMASFCVPFEDEMGEKVLALLICLPRQAMERFAKELKLLLQVEPIDNGDIRSLPILSAL